MPMLISGHGKQQLFVKASVYVDLSNFIGEFRNLLGLGEFKDEEKFLKLTEALATTLYNIYVKVTHLDLYANIKLTPFRLYCYGSYTGAEREAFIAFKDRLKSFGDVEIHLTERSKKEREKGIDIMLATDMLVHAVWDNYDVAILISGDADFEPVVRRIRDLGKRVYVSFYPYAVAEKLKESSDGLIQFGSAGLELASKPLATVVVSEFNEALMNRIYELLKEVKTKECFEPLRELEEVGETVKLIEKEVRCPYLRKLADYLNKLHQHTSVVYQQLRSSVPSKQYSQLSFKLGFYRSLILSGIE